MLLVAGGLAPRALAYEPPGVAFAFLDSVAGRLDLRTSLCSSSVRALFSEGSRIVCYRHAFDGFDAFRAAWSAAAVWPDRFRTVASWTSGDAVAARFALFALDATGIVVLYVPGPQGRVVFALDDASRAARAFPPDVTAPARTPYEAMIRLGARDASQVMTENAMEYAYGERACAHDDGACMVRLPNRTSGDVFTQLGMGNVHWRVGDLPDGHLYSAWVDDLVLVVAESGNGVSVTAARASVVQRAGAPVPAAP